MIRPRAIMFDWDNTLIDSWGAIHRALGAAFMAMGREPWTLEETRRRVRASARESFPVLFGKRADEASEIFYRAFEAEHLETLREREGAGDMLRALAADEALFLAVVSNKQGYLLRREAERLGWSGYFQRLVGASDAARDKPAIEAVELALAEASVAPGPEVWMVGDTDIDLHCARNAGCVPVLLRQNPPAEGEFADAPPRIHLPSCAALRDTLRAL